MALTATLYRFAMQCSDVDRGVYESLDLRLAKHPSETERNLLLRLIAFGLCHAEGLAFSKGGLSNTEEPALSIRSPTGELQEWIEVGSPSADRVHRAAKACPQVKIFTAAEQPLLEQAARSGVLFAPQRVEVVRIDVELLDALVPLLDRHTALELTQSDGRLYVSLNGQHFEGDVHRSRLG
jgi:uncharacterized protein YaeQ